MVADMLVGVTMKYGSLSRVEATEVDERVKGLTAGGVRGGGVGTGRSIQYHHTITSHR